MKRKNRYDTNKLININNLLFFAMVVNLTTKTTDIIHTNTLNNIEITIERILTNFINFYGV